MIDIKFAWSELGGDPALLTRVSTVVREGTLPSRLPVRQLARACVGACALAAAELGARRAGLRETPGVRVDDGAVAAAFVSERQTLVGERAPVVFAPLSRFWRTSDGWVRTHANYPHHRERLLRALGLPADADSADSRPAAVEAVLASRRARDVEEAVYAAGGLAVALRTPQQWAAHEQAAAIASRPLVERARLDGARVRAFAPMDGGPLLPAAGVRVLDLTRVLAGPVATRTLALLGADVLRVDAPGLPELPDQHADTGFGKRSALLDLTADRRALDELLATADVVVTGYRPGALDRFGLSPEALAERRPGVVVAQVSAWGAYGPWGDRRGFDSLVQAATGIAALEGTPGQPGALPAQALDHGSGYLLAAGVLRALTEQSADGGARLVRLALARTAAWLTEDASAGDARTGAKGDGEPDVRRTGDDRLDLTPWLARTDSPLGRLRYALPPVRFDGGPTDWARPPGRWGADPARWR
ncbi:CoA transferase [Streptomyces sp. ME08-AFT2]|uniref:CoA transferase n=1 Tax=Streptomyces sp. ME08-AFT2 TaxID=3028683 RepID=UPI0029B2654D|nr:CoA transferase [Streptomyces sp. ME08-AFT2]MDX3312648.1 CoA transferase [Streptomyces sp. ME08-AFT2]